jgi:acetate kinase
MTEPKQSRPVSTAASSAIRVINRGSSSVKFALFAAGKPLPRLWSGAIERIGLANGRFHAVDTEGAMVLDEIGDIADHNTALRLLLDAIELHPSGARLAAVGHPGFGARAISTENSRVFVEAIPTDEELMIARHARDVLVMQRAARGA